MPKCGLTFSVLIEIRLGWSVSLLGQGSVAGSYPPFILLSFDLTKLSSAACRLPGQKRGTRVVLGDGDLSYRRIDPRTY